MFRYKLSGNNISVQLRPPRHSIPTPFSIEQLPLRTESNSDILPQLSTFSHNITQGINNSQTPVIQVVVSHADRIGEYNVEGIIVRPSGQPFDKPGAALQAIELLPQSGGIAEAVLPRLGFDKARSRPGGWRAQSNMWHDNNLCAQMRRVPHVLNNVVVVTDRDAAFPATDVENHVLFSLG